jgi:Protein of unknown function (DUF4012)
MALSAVLVAIVALVGVRIRNDIVLVKRDLVAAQLLLSHASDVGGGSLHDRITRVLQARSKTQQARARLRSSSLGPLASVPIVGRDVRVVRAIADGADATAGDIDQLLTALAMAGRRPGGAASVNAVVTALTDLTQTLHRNAERVERTTPLLATRQARAQFLAKASEAEQVLLPAVQASRLVAAFYGPRGSTRYLVGFQNPAELRGTGGLIGVYGILESAPSAPVLQHAGPIEALQDPGNRRIRLAPNLLQSYEPFGFDGDWRQVNLPPDLPTVGEAIVDLYRRSRDVPLHGVIMIDPLGSAEILRVTGPIVVDGQLLNAANLPRATMVDAYARYRDDARRKRFLANAARRVVQAMLQTLMKRPVEMTQALASAVRKRHLQLYSDDRGLRDVLLRLGMAGSGSGPPTGDYVMPVGINEAANKLDAFLRRSIRYDVKLRQDGGANAMASITLRNEAPAAGLPRTVIGPNARGLRPGENRQFQELYLASGYGLVGARQDGRRVGVYASRHLNALMLGQDVFIPAKRSVTIAYQLERPAAVQVDGQRIRYRLLTRPQPTYTPDVLKISITAPQGWRFASVPGGFRTQGATASWSGVLDQERTLDFEMERSA